jgi:uncharacterized membrane protein YgaE (UPF0421/DUF939 family)
VAVSFFCKLNQPFFAVIATVMSMGKSIDISFKSGKNKLVGVVIGVVIGYCFSAIAPANAGLCGVGVILTLYLCQLFKLKGAATLSCFLFAGMMFMYNLGTHIPLRFAVSCTIDSFIGIAIALIVNLIVMPPNYAQEIKKASIKLRAQIEESIKNAATHCEIDTRAVEAAIRTITVNVNMYITEAKFLRWNDDDVFTISCKISTYQMILDELRAVQMMKLSGSGTDPDGELLTVYRYHMDRMCKLFQSTGEQEEIKT